MIYKARKRSATNLSVMHVNALTDESLESREEIAKELALRDELIISLANELNIRLDFKTSGEYITTETKNLLIAASFHCTDINVATELYGVKVSKH